MVIEAPTWLQNEAYSARLDRNVIAALATEGVKGLSQLRVSERSAGADLSVDVSPGSAVVEGDDEPFQGNYFVRSTSTENLAVAAPPGSNSRIDLVVAVVDDATAKGSGADEWRIEILTGTVAASPVPPALPDSAIPLAEIGPITSSTFTITDSIIADVRPLSGRVAPAGTVEAYTGARVPTGWAWCDGGASDRVDWPDLDATYADQGYPYGPGDGVNTFNRPDLRGRIPLGVGGPVSGSVGALGGATTHTLTTAEMPSHTHSQNAHNHSQNSHNHSQNSHSHGSGSLSTNSTGSHSHGSGSLSTNSAGSHIHSPLTGDFIALGGSRQQEPYTGGTPHGSLKVITFTGAWAASDMLSAGSHSHSVSSGSTASAGSHSHSISGSTSTTTASNNATTATNNATTATNNNTGGGDPHNNLQPYQLVNGWIVKL